jgi:hypothetical protein
MAIRTTDIREDDDRNFVVTMKIDNRAVMIVKAGTLSEASTLSDNFIREGNADTRVLLNENV